MKNRTVVSGVGARVRTAARRLAEKFDDYTLVTMNTPRAGTHRPRGR
jgi:hypothetical protein